ncbi:nucleoside/nucleotide kinase family protein [Clostridium hydrogenum]|uniref:guanylate kinase n=1 Tax=Clostridium hydrogenum TaxID=2855764 RepID=UPI001F2406BB|nr:guanylate kinase [Clostridium hydrogenum]
MGKIFCVMGKSSSGKDTIFKALRDDKALMLKPIITYTTRPKRINETDGIEYHFINEDVLEGYKRAGRIIEERVYNTINGKWHYSTIDDGQVELEKYNYILIATLESYQNLKKYFGDNNVVAFYINVEDGERLERAIRREKNQMNPNYNEVCRRFLADNEDFSEEKLKKCNIYDFYNNLNLKKCIHDIKNDILKFII